MPFIDEVRNATLGVHVRPHPVSKTPTCQIAVKELTPPTRIQSTTGAEHESVPFGTRAQFDQIADPNPRTRCWNLGQE